MKRAVTIVLVVVVLVIVLGMLFVGCSVNITGMKAANESIEMVVGDVVTPELEFEFDDAEASQEEIDEAIEKAGVTWISSDEAIVKVIDGDIEAVGAGEAKVTASDTSGDFVVTISVMVAELANDIDVEESLMLAINGEDALNLDAKVLPVNAVGELTYLASDEAVVTVDEDGEVAAVANGEAVITVTLIVRDVEVTTKEVAVTVITEATEVGLDDTGGWIYVGGEYTLEPYAMPEDASATEYTYASNDEDVATVSQDGVITGESVGEAVITVTDDFGNTTDYTMTVRQYVAPAAQITSSGGTTTDGGAAAPAPAPAAPAPAPVDPGPAHYHGNGSDAGACPVCGLEYSPALIPGDGTNGGQAGGF